MDINKKGLNKVSSGRSVILGPLPTAMSAPRQPRQSLMSVDGGISPISKSSLAGL